jgi:hypothetical protein
MDEGRPSATAMVAAMQRAEHLLCDDDPKIFQDPLARGVSGIASASALQARLGVMQAEQARHSTPEVVQVNYRCARAGSVVRQRYAEDALDEWILNNTPWLTGCTPVAIGPIGPRSSEVCLVLAATWAASTNT